MTDIVGDLDLTDRLARQLAFVVEIDKVKQIVRRNTLTDGTRCENDAEHQWHLAVMALLLAEHAAEPVDVGRVVAMVLTHDLVEIDAGDAFLYDPVAREAAVAKEEAAAERIFGILPEDQEQWVRSLWEEFEAGETPEARFAASLDRLQPIMQNAVAGGVGWAANGVGFAQVSGKAEASGPGSPTRLDACRQLLRRAVETGAIDPGPGQG
jgi:putative hydrolase of HD superfamily